MNRDLAMQYCNNTIRALGHHKFEHYVIDPSKLMELQDFDATHPMKFTLEIYVNDFMSIIIPTSQAQVEHVTRAVMSAIHDIFPADKVDSNDPISEKKLKK